MRLLVGIDLGSNSLRVIKVLCGGNRLEVLGFFEKTVRTAEGLEQSGRISTGAISRVIEALRECKSKLDVGKCEIVALCTQAFRVASNSKEVLEEILEHTGIAFRTISGELEAHLSLLGVCYALNLHLGVENTLALSKEVSFLAVDMGGASSEFVFYDGFLERFLAQSLPFGIVTCCEKYQSTENLEKSLGEILMPIVDFQKKAELEQYKPSFLIANSGTPTTLLAIKEGVKIADYTPSLSCVSTLQKQEIREILHHFLGLSLIEQESFVGKFKVDVVPFGAILFYHFMDTLGFEESLVVDCGIREGAILGRILGLV